MKIGFIGLGIMGSRMAMNLQKAGHELVVHNRTKEKATVLIENGAIWADSPSDVATQCSLIYTMLSTPSVVKEVALGVNGFLSQLEKGSLWVDCSTVNPSFSREMSSLSEQHGIRFLDAPVAGTKGPAEKGELLFLVGGEESALAEVQAHLDIMGKKTLFLGASGRGASMKMLINLLLGQSMLAFSEAMALGRAMDLEEGLLFNILTATPVIAPVLSVLRPKLEQENREANFPLSLMQKDLHLAATTAFEHNVPMPSLNVAKEVFAAAKQGGLGEEDFSSVFHWLK